METDDQSQQTVGRRYTVERQDESGEWQHMADTDDFKRAVSLLNDSHRRLIDKATGEVINGENIQARGVDISGVRFPLQGINWETAARAAQIDKDVSAVERPNQIIPFKLP